MIKDMFKTSMFLFVICALAGLMLAYCEEITAPLIKAINEKAEAEARTAVLPGAVSFELKDNLLQGFNQEGKLLGTVINVAPKGYAGEIKMLVGISPNGSVLGTKILSHGETPGLGAKLVSPEYTSKFAALLKEQETPDFRVTKDGGHVDTITAATISSRAFSAGIREAIELFKNPTTDNQGNQKEVTNE
jgi:electron transport complex protein RnfG